MKCMKQAFSFSLALSLVALLGCSGSITTATTEVPPKNLTLDKEYVIVISKDADDTTVQAANLLQTTMDWKMRMEAPSIDFNTPSEKAIVLSVDSSMTQGQWNFKISGTNLYITASESHILLYAVKLLRQSLLSTTTPTLVTVDACQSLSGSIETSALPFTFISQNILYKDGSTPENTIDNRAPRFQSLVFEYAPDILAIQENRAVWGFHYKKLFGTTYSEINFDVENETILYRTDRYELVESGNFWYSDTPNVPRSKFDTKDGPRACAWATLKDLVTGKEILVFNTHLGIEDDATRLKQMEVLIAQMEPKMASYPIIACGDMNSTVDSPAYGRISQVLTDSRLSASKNLSTTDITSHNFFNNMKNIHLIDYIFHNNELEADLHFILSDDYGGYVSDHYGILTEFHFVP